MTQVVKVTDFDCPSEASSFGSISAAESYIRVLNKPGQEYVIIGMQSEPDRWYIGEKTPDGVHLVD